MRLLLSSSAAVVLAVLIFAACNSSEGNKNRAGNTAAASQTPAPGHIAPSDGVKRVTVAELRDALEKGTAVLIDVRGDAAYKQNHIKGSVSIPVDQIGSRTGELPRDKTIITYCS
jgi:3-mercaptopyruvate sulfurtransferase SseA